MPRRAVVFAPVFIFVLIVGVNYYMPLLFSFLRRVATMTDAQRYVSGTASMAFVTVPNMEVAKKLAGDIVQKRLAACVNIIPGVKSVYEWQGKIEQDDEMILMIKTLTSKVDELSEYVRNNHPYDCAEVISSQVSSLRSMMAFVW
ncbi:cuta divalent cation tolerance homolog [Plakobranchus ocellatus]|uniref:Cuta divalent cation tolerance homolog n=1 Tax=Plakobranchus ocellatus TaxID=259542 RepID=A0AAV3YYU9_9GAST|nr:cuta divalent cation tolerance homolog [Plakobranchus ocellatus]